MCFFPSISFQLPPLATMFYFSLGNIRNNTLNKRENCSKYKFHKYDVFNKVVREKLTGPWEGGRSGGRIFNLIIFSKHMIGYCTFVSANEIIENLGQNHN